MSTATAPSNISPPRTPEQLLAGLGPRIGRPDYVLMVRGDELQALRDGFHERDARIATMDGLLGRAVDASDAAARRIRLLEAAFKLAIGYPPSDVLDASLTIDDVARLADELGVRVSLVREVAHDLAAIVPVAPSQEVDEVEQLRTALRGLLGVIRDSGDSTTMRMLEIVSGKPEYAAIDAARAALASPQPSPSEF